jgi:hypothetical protein
LVAYATWLLMPELPSTRLLMNGADGFRKTCCGDVCAAGCVQLWFSIAITNTVFTRPAPSITERFWASAVTPLQASTPAAATAPAGNPYFR